MFVYVLYGIVLIPDIKVGRDEPDKDVSCKIKVVDVNAWKHSNKRHNMKRYMTAIYMNTYSITHRNSVDISMYVVGTFGSLPLWSERKDRWPIDYLKNLPMRSPM